MAAPMKVTRFALRAVIRRSFCTASSDNSSAASKSPSSLRDPMPVFMQEDVQRLLEKITSFDVMQVAGPRKVPLHKPKYALMTDEELEEIQKKSANRMKYRLQMPPFMKAREPISSVVSHDPDLQGLNKDKFVFTDISYGLKNRERVMVVREPDGTLRKASWEERDRINQIYHPLPGRQLRIPEIFTEANLESLLKRNKFVYVLDAACVQFEPDDPEFLRVTHRTYEAVESSHRYDDLRSTRHFGPMTFYYCWYKKIDNLLIDMINREQLSDASDLIKLYCIIQPTTEISQHLSKEQSTDIISLLKAFCKIESSQKSQLEMAIQGFEDKLLSSVTAKS